MADKKIKKGVRHIRGDWQASGKRFGIVVARFNEYLTEQLLDGALDTLLGHGAKPARIRVVRVPGAFEIPIACQRLIRRWRPDALITLAVVIRGETRHFNQVVDQSAKGVRELSLKSGVPVILGMVSAMNAAQAVERVGLKQMNKGREWALAALEMASLMDKLK